MKSIEEQKLKIQVGRQRNSMTLIRPYTDKAIEI